MASSRWTIPRILATIDAIDRDLTRNGHVYRYRGSGDGLAGDEGTFVFCTLWLVAALARSGQVEKAKERFEMVLGCANDLGLLAEEIDAETGMMLGNYPQAFSHIGVIGAAMSIHLAGVGSTGAVGCTARRDERSPLHLSRRPQSRFSVARQQSPGTGASDSGTAPGAGIPDTMPSNALPICRMTSAPLTESSATTCTGPVTNVATSAASSSAPPRSGSRSPGAAGRRRPRRHPGSRSS